MIKSRKLLTVASLILGVSMLVACGSKQVTDKNDEDLTQPQYETQSMPDNIKVMEDGVKVVEINGRKYRELEFFISGQGYKYLYLPYIPNAQKVQEVIYYEDVYSDNIMKITDRLVGVNKPDGTKVTNSGTGSIIVHTTDPMHGDNQETDYNLLIDSSNLLSVGTDNGGKMKIGSCDVQALSFALYENYYDKVPNLTVKIYGLPAALWEKNVGTGDKFTLNRWMEYNKECKESNYSNCALLFEREVDKTGVYYIDYRELAKKGDYMQYFFVAEFDAAMEYTYYVMMLGGYGVDDESAYAEWKKQHAEQFIAGY